MIELEQEFANVALPADTYISVGVFDGVHAGHRHLLELLVNRAREANCVPCVVTFRNNPRTVLDQELAISTLTPIAERTRLLYELGIEIVAPITFTRKVSEGTADEFMTLLQDRLRMRGLVVGPDFALGHNRQGTPDYLQTLGAQRGFSVTVADFLLQGGTRVSSTLIRDTVARGDLASAAQYLGRCFSILGDVVHGEGRGGSQLGYPTANLSVEPTQALPSDGIYSAWAYVGDQRFQTAISIGVRPTFGSGNTRTVEAFLLDFEGDLYGEIVRLEFVQRLRDELAFTSTEALRNQIAKDVEDTRRVLG